MTSIGAARAYFEALLNCRSIPPRDPLFTIRTARMSDAEIEGALTRIGVNIDYELEWLRRPSSRAAESFPDLIGLSKGELERSMTLSFDRRLKASTNFGLA